MCLGVPGKIIEINGDTANVSVGGTMIKAALQLVEDAKVGEYVLIHTGFALQKISEKEAAETLKLIKDLESGNPNPNPE
jgi:hydrogenase expression/formation protein HypC